MPEKQFNKTEKAIMRLLYGAKIPLTAYEISKELGISFPTIQKYLGDLAKNEIINETEEK